MFRLSILIIAIFEIVGGAFGIGFVVLQVVIGSNHYVDWAAASIALVVYGFGLAAGVSLIRDDRFGRIASIAVQSIQLPKYASQLFVFMFSFGFDAYPYVGLTNTANVIIGFDFKYLAFHQLLTNVDAAPVIFGFSLPASISLAILLKHKPHAASSKVTFNSIEEDERVGPGQLESHR